MKEPPAIRPRSRRSKKQFSRVAEHIGLTTEAAVHDGKGASAQASVVYGFILSQTSWLDRIKGWRQGVY